MQKVDETKQKKGKGKAAVFMLVVLAVVLVIDWVSVKIRDKYIVKSQRGMKVKI